jgi:hypothetical protein
VCFIKNFSSKPAVKNPEPKVKPSALESIQREVLNNMHSAIEFDKLNSNKSSGEQVPKSVDNMVSFLKNYQPETYEQNKASL